MLVLIVQEIRKTIVTRPYPTGPQIMEYLGRQFPKATQRQLSDLCRVLKQEIAEHDLVCNLAKQNRHAN